MGIFPMERDRERNVRKGQLEEKLKSKLTVLFDLQPLDQV